MEDLSEFSAEGFNVNCTNFMVDDLFNFPQEDNNKAMSEGLFFEPIKGGNSVESSTATAVDSCNSSVSGGNLSSRSFTDVQFPGGELCVPYDDLAELEWLSNFVEESFSSDDMHNLQFIPTPNTTITTTSAAMIGASSSSATTISDDNLNQTSLPMFSSEVSVPGKARSKRSRTAPGDWSSRLLHLSPAISPPQNNPPKNMSSDPIGVNTLVIANNNNNIHLNLGKKKRILTDTPGRKCLHCASEKTPQWRTGPLGPKTLCNACGVRYKSGRLVPEYRPASSPTFVSAKHSNSHRKVLEMRRHKEMQNEQSHEAARQLLSENDIFGISNGGDDYLIHQPQLMDGHDFSHMIV
ncbi:hypothetical protein Leryth_010232 [Lithospermum erythrorhizon]|nr:hypothetical protein Leryth_010232 [Lithospermum erythrorhizon]